jgi:hypothetical protein
MVSLAQIVFIALHAVINPVTPGVIALGMILVRELYPNWRPGIFRQRYDQALAIFVIVTAVLAVVKVVGLAISSNAPGIALNINPAAPGAIALGMILVRELTPRWRPGIFRRRYDQTLVLFVILAVALAVLKVVDVALLTPSGSG